MPKSKRAKVVPLTQAQKKDRAHKESLIETIREAIDKNAYIHVFSVANMRNTFLKEMREDWKDRGRFFMGKTKLMAKALGLSPEDEYQPALGQFSQKWLHGPVGLFLTNETPERVTEYFAQFERDDFARGGVVATETITLPEGGPMSYNVMAGPMDTDAQDDILVPASMETQLRQLGMPTCLKKGQVHLMREFVVCREGEPLTHEQARMLKLFSKRMAEFKVCPLGYWHSGTVVSLANDEAEQPGH